MPQAGALRRAGHSLGSRALGRDVRLIAILSITETISWGIVYYAFAVFLTPMVAALGASTTTIGGALSLALVVSALVGIPVGRYLDHRGPRALMTAGSLVSVLLVVAWSQIDSVAALYAVWVGLGCAMATVLYEPAFVVLAKWIPDPAARRRAMTTMTLAAALASFIFVPLAQLLLDRHGWRDAILLLAAILAVTIPLHLLLPASAPPPARGATGRPPEGRCGAPSAAWTSSASRSGTSSPPSPASPCSCW